MRYGMHLGCFILGLVGCSHTLGTTRLDDGNELTIEGRGTKTTISVKCLTESEIKQLTGSNINPRVEKASCYTVVFVAADSSAISKAITAYTRAETELNDKVAGVVTGGQVTPTSTPGADIAKKILADSLTKNVDTLKQDAGKLVEHLDDKTKADLKTTLKDISSKAQSAEAKTRADALLEAL